MFKSFARQPLRWYHKFILAFTILSGLCLCGSYLATWVSPKTSWVLAFMGLAYPFFMLFNLFFLLCWAFIKRGPWILIPLFSILIGFNHHRHFFQITFSSGPINEKTIKLKVMNWNVRLFDLYDEKNRYASRAAIFEVIKREDPDIITFQEFYHTDREGFFETRDTLITFLRANNVHEGYTHKMHHEQYFGVATFSAYPIVGSGEISFGKTENNNAIYTDIKAGEDTIRIYNAHLSSIRFQRGDYEYIGDTANSNHWVYPNQKPKLEEQKIFQRLKSAFIKRVDQSAILLEHIKKSPYPVILTGDFNDTPVSYFYRTFNSYLTDAFVESGNGIGNTYIGKFPSFRIDYIFHSENLHSYQYTTYPEELSDHHAISCMIEILP